MIAQYVHKAIEATTPWLVGAAIGFLVLWLVMLCRRAGPFAKELKWFFSLTPLHKFIVIFAVGLSALWGGSKERGHLPPGSVDGRASTVSRVVETVLSRSLPEGLSEATNVLAITDFAVDRQNRELAFGTTWASNLFDYTDSRRLYLFSSTNLRDGAWAPLCAFPMPSGTNSHAFTVASDDVDAAMRPWFLDALAGAGFFRFGLDFDSDGDGLTDAHERYWTFTDPKKADTDGDGLSDGAELSASIGTDPLLYDTDGDGVGDGDEIAVRSDPLSSDTDGDGLSDAAEIGTMAALTGDGFLWFDLSGGTRLMTSQTVDDSSWKIPLPEGLVVNNACYTNAKIHVDGTVHLLCPTNAGAWESACIYGSLGDTQYSPCHVTVALCGADLYARTNDWGSQILHGTAESGGRRYTVVEYRSVGLYAYRETNETLTCQLILPHDETNTVYVSYLCVSNTFREVDLRAGVQCGGMPSFKSGNACYNLTWPLTAGFPEDGLTIKYTIGAGSDPASPDTDGDGLSDSDEVLACRTNPLVADTDGDGLCDGEEVRTGTDPLVADTDGDGMPDGWEVRQGLDPLADDSVSDPDGDGLANLREYALGTSPTLSDTDGDGLSDREEVGWWEYADSLSLPEFDVSGGTNLLSSTRSYSGGTFVVPLPFTFRCAGYVHTNIAVGVCGMVGLMSDRNANSSFFVPSGNGDMESTRISSYHTAVAAYWDYLRAPANGGVQITVADVETNGCRYAVVEYANIRLNTQANNASCVATFQIVLPQAETNTVYVRYVSLSDGFDGSGATIGAQLPNRERTHQISYNTAGAITNGTVIAYHFGTGSDPTVADTDGDGLEDGAETTLGTSARHADTDGDGLTDAWEHAYGLDPLSDAGNDGADGDPDGDCLSNLKEMECGTDPSVADTDGDGLNDGGETGCIFATNAIPWLVFDAGEHLTTEISTNYRRCASRALPVPLRIQGEAVTNLTLSANGLVFLDRVGYANPGDSASSADFSYSLDVNALVLAPYLQYAYIRSDIAGRQTSIKYGTATHDGEGYLLVEYLNSFYDTSSYQTNAISFQIAIPTNTPDRAYVRYADVAGRYMDGRYASIGMQTFGGRWRHSWCHHSQGRVSGGLALEFLFGANSDPLNADTDGDGLSDRQEVAIGSSPVKRDTDGDGMTDDWEAAHGLDPGNASGADGAAGDPDGDGLSNVDEYQNGCDPQNPDTDGDGVGDGAEVARGSNPADASDAGTAPDEGLLRELTFNINGDYAAWEMTIEGLGPGDARVRRITMGAPNALQNVPLRMRKGSSYRLSMRWLNSDGHTDPHSWYCWQAKIDGVPSSPSYRGYSTERLDGNEVLVGGGWVAENADGLLSAHVHTHDPDENGQGGGNVAEGLVATLHVLDDPELVPDMDRDGRIGEDDAALAGQGRPFRVWTNDDGDRSSADGDMARAVSDEFPANGLDWDTGKVNGRRDLVDYAAVWLNLKPVADSVPTVLRPSLTYRLRHPSGALNAVWSTMGKDGLASFFRSDMSGFGPALDQDSRLATKERIGAYGLDVPSAFVALAEGGGPQGVFWVDGRHASAEPLWIDVLYGSRVVCSNRLAVSLSGVEDMYRWMNMRGVCGAPVGRASALGVPANFPDAESDGRQFVFVHGYNVDETSARAWSAEMFKRLWQSGSRAMFTAVTWYGNDSQGALYLGNTPDYYSNVDHALSTAGAFGSAVAALPGTARYVAAHSLGNMMVSSAIAEHGLSVARYFMLNAAVPLEAYDPNAVTAAMRNNMTPGDWRPYALRLRAGHWHGLFGTADARRDLTWKGRFVAIANAVNYYSTDEDVLNNADGNPKDLLSPDYAWANQETRKGVWPTFLPGNNEAGWSFNADYDVNNPDYVGGGDPLTLHLTPAKAAQLTDAQLRTAPFFGAFDDMSICTTNQVLNIPQKNQLLADAIPAESYAAGRNPISNFLNRDMRGMKSGGGKWTHSFLVEAPYAWVYQVFDDMKMRSDQ